MATDREQLTELRKDYIRELYKGQPEDVVNRASKYIDRMDFATHQAFKDYANEEFKHAPSCEATGSELDGILEYMGLGKATTADHRSEEDKALDEIFKHI